MKDKIKHNFAAQKYRKRHYQRVHESGINRHLKSKYSLDLSDFRQMYYEQNDLCGICFQEETSKDNKGYTRKLSVDHCHKNNKIRGLLCNSCNNGLGRFKDSIDLLYSAIRYLEESKKEAFKL